MKKVVIEDRRDARGRWLPGAIPPGGTTPALVGERRAALIDLLRRGMSVVAAARTVGISDDTVWNASHDDEEIRAAILASHQTRRMGYAERIIDEMLDRVVRQSENDEKAQDSMRRAIAVGTLLDAHAKAAGLYQGYGSVNVAIQINVPRNGGEPWTLPPDE